MRLLITAFLLIIFSTTAFSQFNTHYSASNAHSHNDYEQTRPFYAAYGAHFGSIEADIFLVNNELLVAHQQKELPLHRTLDSLYLQPLQAALEEHNGLPYQNSTQQLQLLIDIKTDSIATVNKLLQVLQQYPHIIHNSNIHIVLTGNLPDQSLFIQYPSYILFDGVLHKQYTPAALSRIVMLSDDFKNYSTWNGMDTLPQTDLKVLQAAVAKAHTLHKKVRFWDAPDNSNAWETLEQLRVDYINTDHIAALASFLQK
jgi:alkaline phosphatase